MEDDLEQLDYGDLASPEPIKKSKTRDEQEQLEDDLYGDLVPESFAADGGLQDKVQELTEQTQQQSARIAELEGELQERTQERDALAEEKTVLVRNISCLFKTAQLEVDRKDNEIKKLRARLGQAAAPAARPPTPVGMSQAPRPPPPDPPGPPLGPPPGPPMMPHMAPMPPMPPPRPPPHM